MVKKKKVKVKPQKKDKVAIFPGIIATIESESEVPKKEDEAWTGDATITMIDLKDVNRVNSLLGNKQGDIEILRAMGMPVNEPKKNLNITID